MVKEKNIVIIDNNLAIRETLKREVSILAKKNKAKISIFSSENGIEGLGYLYVTKPELIIIDTTLPKYSGDELVNYVLTNKRFRTDSVRVIIVSENKKKIHAPKNFEHISKSSPNFLQDIKETISQSLGFVIEKEKSKRFSESIIRFANNLDIARAKYSSDNLLTKPFRIAQIVVLEFLTILGVVFMFSKYGKTPDSNVKQSNRDNLSMRRKHYPTLALSLIAFILFVIAISGFSFGQRFLLDQTKEQSSAYGEIKWFSTLDSESDINAPFEGTAAELVGNPAFEEGYGGNAPVFDSDNEAVRIVNPVEGEDYSLEKGAIEFFYKPLQAHTVDLELTFFSIYYDSNNKIEFKKLNDGNDSLSLTYMCDGCDTATELVDGADYSWAVDSWIKMRVEWNATTNIGNQLKIFVDEVLSPHTDNIYPIDSVSMPPAEYIYIGNSSATGTNEANGQIDEFAIYTEVLPPTATPVGTPAPTPVYTQNSGLASWHSTLDNEAAITTPEVGTGGTISRASFIDGPEGFGSAAHFDSDEESIVVPIVQGIDYTLSEGAIEFYYRPVQAYTVDSEISFFSIRYDDDNQLRLYKKDNAGSNALALEYRCPGTCDGEEIIASSDYSSSWVVNSWTHFRVEWNDSAILSDQLIVYIDGVAVPSTDQIGSIDPDSIVDDPQLIIGNESADGLSEALGSIDDFKIFLTTVIPTATNTPIPSSTPTPSMTPIPSITPTFTPTPIWYSTMDDVNSITTPAYGSSANEVVNLSFVAGLDGNAAKFDNVGEYINIGPVENDFDETKGRITFNYRGDTFHQNGREMTFFQIRNIQVHQFVLYKESNNDLILEYNVGSMNYNRLVVSPSDYSWSPGQWVSFEIYYDITKTDPKEELRLFINGLEPPNTHVNNSQVTSPINGVTMFFIGNRLGAGSEYPRPVRGAIDDFAVYNYFVNVPTPTVPLVSPTPTEPEGIGILWYSTMDNAGAMTSPVVGTGMSNISSGLSYPTIGGRTGTDFANVNNCADTTPLSTDYSIIKGEIEYYFNPNSNGAASTSYAGSHFRLRHGGSDDYIVGRHNGTNFIADYKSDTTRRVTVSLANYSSYWVVGSWVHIRIAWDNSLPEADKLRIYFNNVEVPHTDSGTMDVDSMTLFNNFTLGNNACATNQRARGVIDEFKIWGLGTGISPTPSPSPYPTTAANPIWYSTLNDASAITTPVVGNPATSSNVAYVNAVSGNGARIDDNNEHITVSPIPTNQFVKSQGAIEFYYIPDSEEGVNDTLTFFNVGTDSNNYLRLTKENNANNDVLNLDYRIAGSTRRLQSSVAQYQNMWTAGNSILFRAEWDESLDATNDLKLFMNGIELPHTDTGTQFTSGAGNYALTIGNSASNGTQEAEGIIDEFKIYGDPNSRNYIVTHTGDGGDSNIGDRICANSDGNCTLRAAIQESNNSSAYDNIIFNIAGEGPHTISPATDLPAVNGSVTIDGTQESGVNCSNSTLKIVLNGQNTSGDGLVLTGDAVTVRGMAFINFDDGVFLDSSSGSSLYCNMFGLDSDGTTIRRNSSSGIKAANSSDNLVIGGSTQAERNIISGNENGIILSDSNGITILGNYIGTNKTGELNKGNTTVGIDAKGVTNLSIGGVNNNFGTVCQEDCNLISSGRSGIVIGNGSTESVGIEIIGNYMGTNLDGSTALSNSEGIKITKASEVDVTSNLINSNLNGVYVSSVENADVEDVTISDNLIGVNDTSNNVLTKGSNGIVVFSGNLSTIQNVNINNNVVGGMQIAGIYEYGSGTQGVNITKNYLGTNSSNTNLGNKYGVWTLYPTTDNIIGGIDSEDGNVIARNTSYGVYLANTSETLVMNNTIRNNGSDGVAMSGVGNVNGSVNNTVIENSIYNNTRLGINLRLGSGDGANGVTPNDDLDVDQTAEPGKDGPNNLQNFPLILQALYDGDDLTISGFFNSEPNKYYRLDFYSNEEEDSSGYGEAENHVYHMIIQTNENGIYSFREDDTIVVSSPDIPEEHEFFSATATECPDSSCDNPMTMLSTSELGNVGYDSKLIPKSLSFDNTIGNNKLLIAADGTGLISDLFRFVVDEDTGLNQKPSNQYNTGNFSPVSLSSLDSDHIGVVGSADSDQFRVYPALLNQNYCSEGSINLSGSAKATDIAVATNSIGSRYAYVSTEDPDNELYIVRGSSPGNSYPEVGEYLSEVRDFESPIPYYHSLIWDETLFPGGSDVKVQVRTGNSYDLSSEEWYGPDGTRGSYFEHPGDIVPQVVQGKQFFQYRLLLYSSGQVSTPLLNSITVRYGK